jgi:DNA-binding response OmpR family regulator
LVLNVLEHRALWRGRVLPLSERELSILRTLAQEPRRAWSFEELHREVWASSYFGDQSLIKVAIQRLRRKLRAASVTVQIEAVPGFGYRLSTD